MIELRESIAGDLPAFIEMEQDADTSGFILPYSLERHRSVLRMHIRSQQKHVPPKPGKRKIIQDGTE
jgi:hypothetical protein